MKRQIILASSSKSRKKILDGLGLSFSVVPSTIDEEKIVGTAPFEILKLRAVAKGEDVLGKISRQSPKYDNRLIIISCDSGCVLEGELIGKPQDRDDAFEILKKLAGKAHIFATAMNTLELEKKNQNFELEDKRISLTKTEVVIRKMTDKEISSYVEKFDLTSFAGAYSLFDIPQDFVVEVKGSITNVLGLPVEKLGYICQL